MPQVRQVLSAGLCPVYPGEARRVRVLLAPGLSMPAGTVLADSFQQPGVYRPYQPLAVDGSGLARLLLEHDCATDSQARVTLGALEVGQGPLAQSQDRVPAFREGTFRTEELVGLDARAVEALGRLIEGDLAGGLLQMP